MGNARDTILLLLGGTFWGCLGGGGLGAVVGLIYGAFQGDVSLALDGALLGGILGAFPGLIYSAVLGATEREEQPSPSFRNDTLTQQPTHQDVPVR